MKRHQFYLALVAALGFMIAVNAQEERNGDDGEVIKISTDLIQVDVRASKNNRILPLQKENLKLFVDGKSQAIEGFDSQPVKLYKIVVDASNSMKPRKYKRAVRGLVAMMREANLSGSDIKFEVTVFSNRTTALGTFQAHESARLEEILMAIKPGGGTALYASVQEILAAGQSPEHFALIVITDGLDTTADPRYLQRALSASGNLTYLLLLDPRLNLGYEYEIPENDVLTREVGARFQKVFESVVLYPDDRDDIIRDLTNIVKESQSIARIWFVPQDAGRRDHRIRLEHTDSKVNLVYRENFLIADERAGQEFKKAVYDTPAETVKAPEAARLSRDDAEKIELTAAFEQLTAQSATARQAFARALKNQPTEWTPAERAALRATMPENLRKNEDKSAALRKKLLPVLELFNRTNYEIIVVDGAKPFVCNFRTIAVIVTVGALATLEDDELRLATAHELAHELTGGEVTAAIKAHDCSTIRRIEFYSDGVALLAAKLLGIKPQKLIRGIEKTLAKIKADDPAYNENGESHPLLINRKLFFKKVSESL